MSSGIGQLIARMVAAGPAADQPRTPSAAGLQAPGAGGGGGGGGGDGGCDAGWAELLPFRFDPLGRPGHAEALARFARR
ncbi:hypothetical protein TSOC_008408 [Tetrabaena socialis]|uniref:Uncharacterized protein n=1 Tax=Tetrabaena socialis TaxID=47790 RepID=A0A2J7ZYI8_9CHLO|nr:hypothetical protein TSOC_008408 [Tetrabaena socialis]|eukprot:PNH05334.1 hypothetical protein TSOC_008408 [Tetrabaena socialis]